jgi:hypothetical protein
MRLSEHVIEREEIQIWRRSRTVINKISRRVEKFLALSDGPMQ